MTVRQLRAAADALVGTRSMFCLCRAGRLARAADLVARDRTRNRQAAACHRRAMLARLDRPGIHIAALRCCILE